ncbi:MAG: hypothetical protein NVSMB55_22530 [Mycobacteriales bacterium]
MSQTHVVPATPAFETSPVNAATVPPAPTEAASSTAPKGREKHPVPESAPAGPRPQAPTAVRQATAAESAPLPRQVPPAAGITMQVPFLSASLRIPAPGAVATVGPVQLTLPTGALYFGGLAALVVLGTVEAPVAAGAALVGAVLGRRWLRRLVPTVSMPGSTPVDAC